MFHPRDEVLWLVPTLLWLFWAAEESLQSRFASLWHWPCESWDTLVISSWLGPISAEEPMGNRTIMGLFIKPCDSRHWIPDKHTGHHQLCFRNSVCIDTREKKEVMDKLPLPWIEDRVMDQFVCLYTQADHSWWGDGSDDAQEKCGFEFQTKRNTWLAVQKHNTPLGQSALFLIKSRRLSWVLQ